MKAERNLTIICFLILNLTTCFGKAKHIYKIHDSIYSKTYQELYNAFFNNYKNNPKKAKLYAQAFINKGKKQKKPSVVAQGYHYMSYVYGGTGKYLNYLDSIIDVSRNINDFNYPSRAFLLKGDYFFRKRSFKDALDNYILANKFGRKSNNERVVYKSNYSIGILKNRVGEHKEALEIFRECYKYSIKEKGLDYRNDLFALVSVFYKLKLLDSAFFYNKKGIQQSLKTNDIQIYNYFVLGSGVTSFYKEQFNETIDSIGKALKYLEVNDEKPNLAVSYFYLGKAYHKLKSKEQAILYFKKLDSIFQLQKDLLPETREGYEILIKYFEENNNIKKQLEYTQKLVQVDSVLNSNYKYLLKVIIKDYDTSLIVSKKDKTISSLKNKNVISNSTLTITGILLFVFLILFYLNYRKRKYYQKKFDLLISQEFSEKDNKLNSHEVERKNTQLTDLNISQIIVENVIDGLRNFEEGKKYIESDYTLGIL